MSADVARLVLTNCTLRWSSPILFNDPFDVPRELSFGITGEALHLAVGRKLTQLIESPPDDTTQMDPTLRVVVETVKRGIPAKLKAEMLSGLQDIGREERSEGGGMDAMRNLWRRLLPDHRILCLTESAAHTAMWYHYADKYRGIVLEFDCIDELESPWLIAKPVTYSEKKPQIYSAEGWAEIMCLRQDLAVKALLDVATYTKSSDWKYESEWRIASSKRPADTGNFTDYKFDRRELSAVYFGPLISPEARLSVSLAAKAFPHAKLWDVSIGMSRELVFRAHAHA
ncbi:DUF2971 domain-containing protein [Achromobacter veterisilvae]|nr:DUF2971 domain-containing protein [Achromobacter veterisilvae]